MPLIVLILIIIVLFLNAKDDDRKRVDNQRTNAHKERDLIDKYMKQGLSVYEAHDRARRDMIDLGFVPCIPKRAYRYNSSWISEEKLNSYDSTRSYLKRRELMDCKSSRPTPSREQSEIGSAIAEGEILGVGEYLRHLEWGICAVVDVSTPTYKVLVLLTGKVKLLSVNETDKIRRLI